MDETKLNIEYVPTDSIRPYEGNAKLHPKEQIEQIKESIRLVGFRDPIGVWNGQIVEGHGRHQAAQELGMTEVPIIRLDDMTDEERREYMLIHNQTTMNSGFDMDLLEAELSALPDFDADFFGLGDGLMEELTKEADENPYSQNVKIPQYNVTGAKPKIAELMDTSKMEELLVKIEAANIPEEEKIFLRQAACRHVVFNFRNIAEYYANSGVEMQELMEDSALVIIDMDDAIANGYALLESEIEAMAEEDGE